MNAVQTATVAPPASAAAPTAPVIATTPVRMPMLAVLRALLLTQAVLTLALAIFLSLLAAGLRDVLGGDAGRAAEVTLRFAAGAAFLFSIFAAIASRGTRRRRAWAWTMAAVLQLVLAIGTGIAVMTAEWHPVFLAGFAMAAAVMLVLCTASVRRALAQL
ncbi:MAG TPA: hypothetical protein VM253_07120 [Candidatus Limnocylindrales bacterium]|jgi:hypothetical protein|nr:hypothetical protein [Candidatus Limnocylindrales bacterium]